ncbi:UrcA family protein [Gluconacetobacter aggeris]|uniref:UrcA family protein n=1 Tax=Gluconacetobacter aggeris TaxID=1286186 RepID=A0A7W4NW15_9PROT|nr:UrcA family protein [Gluconacetobacter aggeris]MBB2168222.1 UrcA family protein [Gluconacetobacter aggeris]
MMVIMGKATGAARKRARPFRLSGSNGIWNHVEGAGMGLVIALGLILLLAVHGPANGQDVPTDKTDAVRVAYDGADLRDAAHARGLLARLDHAALVACGDDRASLDALRAAIGRSDCRQQALAQAVARIGAPMLSAALHDAPPA